MPQRRVRMERHGHAASAVELPRSATAPAGGLARSASAHSIRGAKEAPPPSSRGSSSRGSLFERSASTINAESIADQVAKEVAAEVKKKRYVVHTKGWTAANSGNRPTTPTENRTDLSRVGQPAGRLSSEEYGRGMGFRPGVRTIYIPGIKPLCYPSEEEIRRKRRPKTAYERCTEVRNGFSSDTEAQKWTLFHAGVRSSDALGANLSAELRPTAAEEERRAKQPTTAESLYLSQFLYNDPACKPVGGIRQTSTSKDILDAVAWREAQIAKAARMDSWESRLKEPSGDPAKDVGIPAHYAAYRVAERQRVADLYAKGTKHAGTGATMQREGYDSVYSDKFVNKDTESFLDASSLVPVTDAKVPSAIDAGSAHERIQAGTLFDPRSPWRVPNRNTKLPAGRALLPTRTTMGIGQGPGRSWDF
jgi:hypothetical protein